MNVEPLRFGDRDFGEWPAGGFNIEAYGGDASAIWPASAFNFYLWHWALGTDLPPFIQKTFPDEHVPVGDCEERRQKLIELDKRYYASKFGKEHPRYRWGRYEKSVCWAVDGGTPPFFAIEPADPQGRLSKAYEAARSERFA